jgi:ADP-ribose pyrophosphatase YjhB (NUDIX family)
MAKKKQKRKSTRVSVSAGRGKRGAKRSKLERPESGHGSIEFIARGCVIRNSRVLLCRNVKHGYLYLPGGHVEFGESAGRALAREFLEECGAPVRVGALQLVSEGSFATKKREHHEINLVFHVELLGKSERIRSKESGIEFEWVDLSAVVDFDIRPASAKAWLMTLGSDVAGRIEWVSEIGG